MDETRKELPNPEIGPLADKVRPILKLWMRDHGIQRKHLCEKAGLSNRTLDRIRKGYGTSVDEWLVQLKQVFHAINELVEKPPAGVRKGLRRTWDKLFGTDFPPEPLQEEVFGGATGLDRGAADLGVGWQRRGTLPYEELLNHDLAKARAAVNRSKERQLLDRLADLYESTADWEGAIRCLDALREPHLKISDHEFVAECCLRRGIAFYRLERWGDATAALEEGLGIVEQHPPILASSKVAMRLNSYVALIKSRSTQPHHLEAALGIFETKVKRPASDHGSVSWATYHHRRASILLKLGRLTEARKGFIEAINLRLEHGALAEATRSLYFLGEVHRAERRPLVATAVWTICVEHYYSFDDYLGAAQAYLKLGSTYFDLWQRDHPTAPRDRRGAALILTERDLATEETQLLHRLCGREGGRTATVLPLSLNLYRLKELAQESLDKARLWAEAAKSDNLRQEAIEAALEASKAFANTRA
jgi:tetratricopeptide (TPR) repeat protein